MRQTATRSRCPHCGKQIAAEAPRVRKPLGVTARARKRKADQDARYAAKIRARVRVRDYTACLATTCRYAKDRPLVASDCSRISEWAHFGDKQRFKTRGQAPEQRHTTADSLMLCSWHHGAYDHGALEIHAETDQGCDGPLKYGPR